MAEAVKQMNIYQAISNCMEEIGAVGKDSVNKQQDFKYRGIDAVMNAINPALVKNHIFIVPEVLEQSREERNTKNGCLLIYSVCKIKYTFFAEDGSNVVAITVGEGMDSGDKATNKAMAIAFKYACFQVFCIPTEEMQEPDGDTPEPEPITPATADQLKKINDFVKAYADLEKKDSKDIWNVLKEKYNFNGTGEISTELADIISKQVETWYKKKMGASK